VIGTFKTLTDGVDCCWLVLGVWLPDSFEIAAKVFFKAAVVAAALLETENNRIIQSATAMWKIPDELQIILLLNNTQLYVTIYKVHLATRKNTKYYVLANQMIKCKTNIFCGLEM